MRNDRQGTDEYRLVVNRGGDITSDFIIKNKKEAQTLFHNIMKDFCTSHGLEMEKQERQAIDGIFVSKKFGFSAFLTRVNKPIAIAS